MRYRKPSREEHTIINRALAKWGVFDALKDRVFLLGQDENFLHVCLVTSELESAVVNLDPISCGLDIGKLTKRFHPSMEGADLFARLSNNGGNYLAVSEKAEKLVLYGRDVMGDSVISAPSDLHENELVVITNMAGEAIGIGRTRFAGQMLRQKGKITVTTISDAGRYLREETGERQTKMARSPQQKRP